MSQKSLKDFFATPSSNESGHSGKSSPNVSVETDANMSSSSSARSSTPGSAKRPKGRLPLAAIDVTASTLRRRKRKLELDESRQMILDAGQKLIGMQYCQKCGMTYNVDSASDREEHSEFHSRFDSLSFFRVPYSQIDLWKRQIFCAPSAIGLVFKVTAMSKCSLKHRLEEVVRKIVNVELGCAAEVCPLWDSLGTRQVWTVIADIETTPFIAGVVVVEHANKPHYYGEQGDPKQSSGKSFWALGVNRLWVHSRMRRRGLCETMLDVMRTRYLDDRVVPRTRIAFCEPTVAGLAFARKYSPNGRVLVYSASKGASNN